MTTQSNSPTQIFLGIGVGLLLQPVALIVGSMLWNIFHGYHDSSETGWAFLTAPVYFFGVTQAIVIIPSVFFYHAKQQYDKVRGLLYVGIFLALCNVLLWVFKYSKSFYPPLY